MLNGPAGLVVFSCGIRLTPLETDRQLLLAKDSKKPSIGSVSQYAVHSGKVPVLAICYYPVFSGQHIVASIIQFLLVLSL